MVTDGGLDSAKGGGHGEEWQEVKPTGPGCGLDVGSNGWGIGFLACTTGRMMTTSNIKDSGRGPCLEEMCST